MYFAGSIFIVTRNNFVEHTRNRIYKELAFTDGMTKINNRSAFEVYMEKERNKPSSGGCIMIADLNNLKRINDTYGHRLGDEAIINTANLINDNFNDIGNCYRIGGDEFCVLIDDHDTCDISHLISCLRKEEAVYNASSRNIHLQIACGYAVFDSRTDADLDALQKRADQNMYENKKQLKTFSYR